METKVNVEFKNIKTGFLVVFYRPEFSDSEIRKIAGLKVTEEISTKKLVERLGEKLGEKLGENEKNILKQIIKNRLITIEELSVNLKISTTAVENNLAKLKKKSLLNRVGPDKGGHWEVIEK